MTQTFDRVKCNLIDLLEDPDYKVISLKGKWGTGKTYLWQSVATHLFANKKATKQPIYVSLFGAKTINELKFRILQSAYIKDAPTVKKVMVSGSNIFTQIVQKYTGYSVTDAALLWLPKLMAGRLIVIDDVERKHKSLDVDEVLGLIDEYSEAHNARFLIILNTGRLVDNDEMWAKLHEKVIDIEVVLDPSAVESFEIAAKGDNGPYLAYVRAAVAILKINNIRVIERVLRTMKRIVGAVGSADDMCMTRWVPSTVLLTASHYRAIDNVPPFEYIKSFNSYARMLRNNSEQRDANELEWDSMLERLGIHSADEYEEILLQYLQSGILDVDRLKALFSQYRNEAENAAAQAQRNEFFTAFWWDAHRSVDDLLAMARALLPTINVLDAGAITDIVFFVEKLGDSGLARQFLDGWLLSIETRPEYQQIAERNFESPHRTFHPEVIEKMNAMRDDQHPPLTIVETAERILKNSGWGERERISLRNSTVQQYEDALRVITNDSLRRFLTEHLGWVRSGPYDENFKNGVDNFVAACVNICRAEPNSRLSKIIYGTFEMNGLAAKLDSPATASGTAM